MNKKMLLFIFQFITVYTMGAQQNCLSSEGLLSLDASWENALLTSDETQFVTMLAEEFIWVHNHASLIDSKEMLIKRASEPKNGATRNTRSRIQSDVRVIIKGATGIVTGITVVDRGPTPTTYHFMRTYVEIDGKCLLLANHTMAIPEVEE